MKQHDLLLRTGLRKLMPPLLSTDKVVSGRLWNSNAKLETPWDCLHQKDRIVMWEVCRTLLASMVTNVWELVKDQHSSGWIKRLRSRHNNISDRFAYCCKT